MMLKADKGNKRTHELYHIQTNYAYWKVYKLVIDLLINLKFIFEFYIKNTVKEIRTNINFTFYMSHKKFS